MGVIIRQSFKGAFVGYAGAFLGGIINLFIYPYYLTPELIGLTRILFDFSLILAFLGQFGINNAIIKYYPYFEAHDRKKLFVRLMVLFPFVGFSLVLLLSILFKDSIIGYYNEKSALFVHYFYLVFPFALFQIYLNVFEAYSTTLNRITIPKISRDILLRILIVGIVLAYAYLHFSVDKFALLFVLTYGVAMFVVIIYSLSLNSGRNTILDNQKWESGLYRQILVYMSFMFFAGLGSNIIVRTDILMISSMLGLEKTGIYSIAFFMATMIEIPSKATMMIAGPTISRELQQKNIQNVEILYKKNALNQAIIGGILFILVWINIDNIYGIMPKGEIYNEGKYVLLIIALAKLYDSVTGVNNQIIVYSSYYRILLIYVFIMALLVIAGNYFLIPALGMTGAAISSFAGYFFINTISVVFIYYKFKIQPFKWHILYIVLVYALCFLVNYFIPVLSNYFLDAFIRSGIIAILFGIIIYKSKISPELNQLITNLFTLKGLINFLKGK